MNELQELLESHVISGLRAISNSDQDSATATLTLNLMINRAVRLMMVQTVDRNVH